MAEYSDLLLFDPASLTPTLLPEDGLGLVRGPLKLGQRWLIEFFTERSTLVHLPERGTDFLTRVRSGLQTELALAQAFALANLQATAQLTGEEDDTWGDSERLGEAILRQLSFASGQVRLSVLVYPRVGLPAHLLLPIRLRAS